MVRRLVGGDGDMLAPVVDARSRHQSQEIHHAEYNHPDCIYEVPVGRNRIHCHPPSAVAEIASSRHQANRAEGDQARRIHERLQRDAERREKELRAELDAQERHLEYLRGQLADSRSVDRLADAIFSAMPESGASRPQVVRQAASAPPVTPVTPAPVLDLGGLAQAIVEAQRPMITELAATLKPEPPAEVEVIRDDMGNVKGARRKPVQKSKPSLPIDQWPVPK